MPMSYSRGAKKVEELKDQLHDRIEHETSEAMGDTSEAVARQLRLNDSVARRVLVNAIRETAMVMRHPDAIVSRGIYAPSYWRYLEYGTGVRGEGKYDAPIVPPFQAILTWIIAKGIEPRTESIDTQVELATVIQESIADLGTHSHPFVRPAWYGPRGEDHVRTSVVTAIKTAVRRTF